MIRIGFLHLGHPSHGVCRYGRLLAEEMRTRPDVGIIERHLVLTGQYEQDVVYLRHAAKALSQAEIVHLQFTELIWGEALCFPYLRTFFKACHSPIVVTIHDTEPMEASENAMTVSRFRTVQLVGDFFRQVQMACKIALHQTGRRRINIPQHLWIRWWLIRQAAASVVCTSEEKSRLDAIFRSRNVSIIPHFVEQRTGLPTHEEARCALGLEGRRVITLLGFIYGGKGYELLLEAFALLPDPRFLLVFAGGAVPGNEAYVSGIQALAASFGVADRLRITGYLDEHDLEQYLMATDIPVCPYSKCYASSSLSSWLSVCRPILASDLPQFQEYHRFEPEAVTIFTPYTPEALAEAIGEMLDAGHHEERHFKVARLRDQLSLPAIAERHFAWYQSVRTQRRKTRSIQRKNPGIMLPPTGYYETTKLWAAQHVTPGAYSRNDYREIHPKFPFHRRPPKTLESRVNWRFTNSNLPRVESEPTFVAVMRDGRVCGDQGDVITPDNRLLWDLTTFNPAVCAEPKKYWIFQQPSLSPVTPINGRVANLSGDWPDNYHHWLVEILPRLELIRLSGRELHSIDQFIFNRLDRPYHLATLASFGISSKMVLTATPSTHYECEELILPSFIRGAGCGIRWIYQFLRRQFLQPMEPFSGSPLRIYVSRSHASIRNVVNEDEVSALLARYGFQIFYLETLDFFEQVRLFARAEAVIGAHGAGLTNIVFCPPTTKVIEFTMPDRVHYWAIADECGLDYYYMNSFPELPIDFSDTQWNFNNDMVVDLKMLQQTLAYARLT